MKPIIQVTSGNKYFTKNETQKLIEKCLEELLTPQELRNIYLKFSTRQTRVMFGYIIEETEYAMATEYIDYPGVTYKKKRKFYDMVVSVYNNKSERSDYINSTRSNFISTIAHECCHLKQFHRGELSPNGVWWKGERSDTFDQELPPWEEDCFEYETSFMLRLGS